MKLMVVGNQEAVLGFSLAGVNGIVATNAAEVNQALDTALGTPNVGIILVTEDVSMLVQARMDQLKMTSTVPLVVEIPGPGGSPPDKPSLNEMVKRAIGIKI